MQPPVSPMLAAPAHVLPTGPGWAYEPKWDGWRALAFCQPGRVYLQSRTGKAVSAYFPDLTRIIAALPVGAVLDGELLVWDPDRARTSFPLLQRRVSGGTTVVRLAASHPAQYVVFDRCATVTAMI